MDSTSKFLIFLLVMVSCCLADAQNVVVNGDFEDGVNGWVTWSNYGQLSSVGSPVHGGSGSLKIVGASGGAQAYQNIQLEAGVEYSLSGWIYIPDGSITGAFLAFYSHGCGFLFEREFVNGPSSGWQKFGPYRFTPDTCADGRIQLGGFGNGGVIYWDDVVLSEPGATTTDWYAEFKNYNSYMGTYHAANPDGGILAWGEAYLQQQYVNLYEAYGDTVWLDNMVSHVDLMIANMSDVPLFAPYDAQYVDGFAAWGQNRFSQYMPNYTEWLSSHGNIIGPIMRFVEIVYDDPALHAAYKAKADAYLAAIESNIVLLWYTNWDPDPGWTPEDNSRYGSDAGYHVYEWSGWQNQPFNMYLCFTDALVTLRRLSGSPYYTPADPALPGWYVSQTDAMLQYFRSNMMYQAEDNVFIWKYGPNSAWPHLTEDVGHAFLDLQAALQGYDIGVAFDSSDLQRMANAFVHRVWNGYLSDPLFYYYIDGVPSAYDDRGHWGWGFLYLAGYDYRIWESMASYFDQHINLKSESSHISVTAGMLAYAAQLYDVYAPGAVMNFAVASGSGDGVVLSWRRPPLDADGTALTEVAGYNVYRATDGRDGSYERLNEQPIAMLSTTDAGAWGLGHWYKVAAADYAGNESPLSAALQGGALSADFDNNGVMDLNDVAFFTDQWLTSSPTAHPVTGKNPDLVPSGRVDILDFSLLARDWEIDHNN